MKLGVIGFGQAGGKILERLARYDAMHGTGFVVDAVAVNTAKADLQGLELIDEDKRVLIGQSKVKGHGVGADNELGAEVAREDMDEILEAVDRFSIHKMDAILIICGLGGGTGSGGAPMLASELQHRYMEPIYGLGVLPSTDEGGIYNLNAARSLQSFVESVDNVLLFDNDSWRRAGESVGQSYDRMNDELITRLGVLFGAGEMNNADDIGELVVDSSEIINTLGTGGISTLGYARAELDMDQDGLLARFGFKGGATRDRMEEEVQASNRIVTLTRKAVLGRLTHPTNVESTERALVVVAGPPDQMNRKGVEKARAWIEEKTNCMEVRAGDFPMRDENHLAVVVLLSGVTDSDRIRELQRIGIEAQDNKEALEEASAESLKDLVSTEDDELEPLF